MTASDDCTIVFHTGESPHLHAPSWKTCVYTNPRHSGVPFKFDKIIKTHTKFVQDVKYARSGDYFASVGSDYKVFLYDGKSGDELGEFTGEEHKGSVVSYTYSPN